MRLGSQEAGDRAREAVEGILPSHVLAGTRRRRDPGSLPSLDLVGRLPQPEPQSFRRLPVTESGDAVLRLGAAGPPRCVHHTSPGTFSQAGLVAGVRSVRINASRASQEECLLCSCSDLVESVSALLVRHIFILCPSKGKKTTH